MFHRLSAVLAAVVLPLAMLACGDDDAPSAGPGESSVESPAQVINDADVEFAQGMIAHHEQAIQMAGMALNSGAESSAEVQELATRIQAAQQPEIELMTSWLTAWGQPVVVDTAGGHDMGAMDGMMTDEEMEALGDARGGAFDQMWLEMMVRHHEGAIAMSEAIKTDGANPEVAAMAEGIIAAQRAEIDEMTALLTG